MVLRRQLDSVFSEILLRQADRNISLIADRKFHDWVQQGNTQIGSMLKAVFMESKGPWVTTHQLWLAFGSIVLVR